MCFDPKFIGIVVLGINRLISSCQILKVNNKNITISIY